MIHWEERDMVLFPDEYGTAFSGSAFVDTHNVSGLGGQKPAVLLYYTAAGEPFTQRLVYSQDGLKTLQEYDENPIIAHIEGGNRDPKVVYCEEKGCYVLALYLDEDRYSLFASSDLKNWQQFQEIRLEEDGECPDLFCLKNEAGERRWVFIGAGDRYLVGEFKEGLFVSTQPVQRLHYGRSSYAAQSFQNLPEGRAVRVAWLRWGEFTTPGFSQQVGIPTELTLKTCEGREYLCVMPVQEVEQIAASQVGYENLAVKVEQPFEKVLGENAYLLKLHGAYAEQVKLSLTCFGRKLCVDMSDNQLTFGAEENGAAGKRTIKCPVSVDRSGLDLTILIDCCSIEIFADGGRVYYTDAGLSAVCDYNLPKLQVSANREYVLDNLEIYELENIWK